MPVRRETVLLDRADLTGLKELAGSGAQELADYGAFSLWQLPALPTRSSAVLARLPRTGSRIDLRGLVIDGAAAQPEPTLPPNLTAAQPDGSDQFWLVQFAGPLQDAWLDQLRAAGQSVAACLPEYACILWGSSPAAAVNQLGSLVRWQGAFHPAYRLHPDLRPGGALRAAGGELEVTVQVLDVPAGQAALQTLTSLAVRKPGPAHKVVNLLDVQARIRSDQLDALASLPAVFNIEPYRPPQKNDEMQTQILAGNITTSAGNVTASGPGYLAWLASMAASTNPSDYPILDIVDDGIDSGDVSNVLHPDFHNLGDIHSYSRIQFLNSCLTDLSTNGEDGHGNLNAGIAMGYNAQAEFPYKDPAGFAYGLGVSPYGRIAGTKIFSGLSSDLSNCDSSYTGIVRRAYAAGARISSNSWGIPNNAYYDAGAQEYDQLTRDADPLQAGNQEMLHVFSAGNSGSSPHSVGSPGSAKNVLSVGASDLPRDVGILAGSGRASSPSSDNIADYSSRGPTQDGRAKPDLVAPGTHIQGPASQDPNYNGSGISGSLKYYPAGQTWYTWSTGTSHSAPAVAGAAQLAWEIYQSSQSAIPSPAMLKAILLNSPRYLTGTNSGDTLPSPNQGWGMPDLKAAFDNTPRAYFDQHHIFGSSGENYILNGTTSDPAKPFRITLTWTDAPGSTVGTALVNDLDLEVTVGATKYLGNVFNGSASITGGGADSLNNLENVFLPAGIPSGTPFSVRVVARNITGDGVPNNADPTDQDFALVISNGLVQPQPILSISGIDWQKSPASINPNGPLEPGQSAALHILVSNSADGVDATELKATLIASAGFVDTQHSSFSSDYPDLPAGVALNNLTAFKIILSANQACGGLLQLELNLKYSYIYNNTLTQGSAILPLPPLLTARQRIQTYSYPGLSVPIPDQPPGTTQIPPTLIHIPVSFPYPAYHYSASVSIDHPKPADLQLWLQNGSGSTIQLATNRGGTALGFSNLTFDDNAAVSITTINNPPDGLPLSGTFRPEQPLANLIDGFPPTGTWTLQVLDTQNSNSGLLTTASLRASYRLCGVVDPAPILSIATVAWQEDPAKSDMNGSLDPGDQATLELTLQNENTSAVAYNLSVELQPLSGQMQVLAPGSSSYPSVGDGVSGINHDLFNVKVLSTMQCGQDLPFVLQANYTYDNGSGPTAGSQTIAHVCQKTWLPLLKRFSP